MKQQSRDIKGNLVKDNWGNCGIEYVWNSKHQILSTTYMDEYWKPMKMPNNRKSNAGYHNGVEKYTISMMPMPGKQMNFILLPMMLWIQMMMGFIIYTMI